MGLSCIWPPIGCSQWDTWPQSWQRVVALSLPARHGTSVLPRAASPTRGRGRAKNPRRLPEPGDTVYDLTGGDDD